MAQIGQDNGGDPRPIRGDLGGSIPGRATSPWSVKIPICWLPPTQFRHDP